MASRRPTRRVSVTAAAAVALLVSGLLGIATHASAATTFSFVYSTASNRAAPVTLDGSTVSGSIYAFVTPTTGITQVRFFIDNPTAAGTPVHTEKIAAYDLAGTASNGTANPYNTTLLTDASHTITAAVDKSAGGTDLLTATITVNNGGSPPPPPPPPPPPGDMCSPLTCDQLKVTLPYVLSYQGAEGGIVDGNNKGTGFRMYLRTGAGAGYVPSALAVDTTAHQLSITSDAGKVDAAANTQNNALGVGFAGATPTVMETVLPGLPTGTSKNKQAGLWFGYSQDEIARVAVVLVTGGWRLEYTVETGGVVTSKQTTAVLSISSTQSLALRLTSDPSTRTATASYRIASGKYVAVGPAAGIPGAFFSFDGAGIDPAIGTRSFSGVFATSMLAGSAPVFRFSSFSLTTVAATPPPPPPPGAIAFTKSSFSVPYPTSIVQGPDGKLYVATLGGDIHILTLDASGAVSNDQKVTTLGSRLALGITIDPASTPTNVIVWVSHSSPSVSSGVANSGMVTKLSGPGLTARTDVITGLPRSIANHSVNSLHFGPDGKLYIAVGGNTGAGAANNSNTEFGTRAEQALSAAIVVADVKNPAFDGTCADPGGNLYVATAPCDVHAFATGLRNTYDMVWHSNGNLYGPDNGLGVLGSYPPKTTPPCTGFGSTIAYTSGGNNPGDQPDKLNLIVQGKYYGHPNPVRNECVFGDGHYQKVSPLPNYTPPMYNLGLNQSSDGVVEYKGGAFCGAMKGNLLVTDYSRGKDIRRLVLSADGKSVTQTSAIVQNLLDPLPLTTTSDGRVVVGEFGGGKVTILTPVGNGGCYADSTVFPTQILDAGGVAIGSKLYVVGGKTSAGHQIALRVYDSATGTWASLADKPGPAVENPGVVTYNGKLYVVGGSTAPFSGAVTDFYVYDPASNAWTQLPSANVARGGPGAAVMGTTLYLAGGMDNSGASLSSVEKIDLANAAGWSSAPSLSVARDNPGLVSFGTSILAFGGRTRLSNGTSVPASGVLSSAESLTPTATGWVTKAPMPTARRTMANVVINGIAYALGGEITSTGGAFTAAESYDPVTNTWKSLTPMPVGRHGIAAGVIGGKIHLVGGGTVGGTSFSNLHTIFTPPG